MPPSLSPNGRALLDACAKAIARRDSNCDLDLFPLNRERGAMMTEETVQYLASQVENLTGDKQTIRRADPALFASHGGVSLYLVLCDITTPAGTVTELKSNMMLAVLGPYSNGFDVDARRATPEDAQRYRDFVEQGKRNAAECDQARADAADFMALLTALVCQYAVQHDQPDVAVQLRQRTSVSIDDLASACSKLGLPLLQLVTNGLPR